MAKVEAGQGKNWFEIKQAAGRAQVYIYDEIGRYGITSKDFVQAWNDATKGGKAVDLYVNCPGGSVQEGLAIYSTIKKYKQEVVAHVDGWAASIASVILQAADRRRMGNTGAVMVHPPEGPAYGTAQDMRGTADMMEAIMTQEVGVFMQTTGKSEEEVRGWMSGGDRWFYGQQAVDAGLVDELYEPTEIRQCFNPDEWVGKYKGLTKEIVESLKQTVHSVEAEKTAEEELPMPKDESTQPNVPASVDAEAIRQEVLASERKRVATIRQAAFPGQEALVDKLINDGAEVSDAVVQINQAFRESDKGRATLAQFEQASDQIHHTNEGKPDEKPPVTHEDVVDTFRQQYLREGKSAEQAERMAKVAAGVH